MPTPPARPKIYHIVHVDRLPSVIAEGCLWCDAIIASRAATGTTIGMASIKQRRLGLPVECHPGDRVGDYVPFYFCPRSVMLYLIYQANHPELQYRGGQTPIVHLEADLHDAVAWAERHGRRWAFSLSNAGARYAQFRAALQDLRDVNWDAVAARDWRSPEIREGKQAEFLMHRSFPWQLFSRIGAMSQPTGRLVQDALMSAAHRPPVEIRPDWYYG